MSAEDTEERVEQLENIARLAGSVADQVRGELAENPAPWFMATLTQLEDTLRAYGEAHPDTGIYP